MPASRSGRKIKPPTKFEAGPASSKEFGDGMSFDDFDDEPEAEPVVAEPKVTSNRKRQRSKTPPKSKPSPAKVVINEDIKAFTKATYNKDPFMTLVLFVAIATFLVDEYKMVKLDALTLPGPLSKLTASGQLSKLSPLLR